ncbi:MAG: nucleotide sugar dehydrogenase [Candidatus Omnitrophica bacterium]|jgi:UDP-N-acetyl-D-glucosamine dehydrogenase|nr:nucleotide sugar dehydrogenase [Candidatus Omnitrophota bacterium]
MSYEQLKYKINSRKAKIGVVGLGYVGLPLAVCFAKCGYFVYGLDNNSSRIDNLKSGKKYIVDVLPEDVLNLIKNKKFFPTNKDVILKDSDVIIICVPTPLRKVKIPDISYVVKASRIIKKYLKPGQLIILESTSFPSTTRDIILSELKKSGLKEEKDYFLCFSPERINPGDKKHPLPKIPKIVGGLSIKSSQLAKSLYSQIIKKVFIASSPEAAESAKLLENTFRLVNIALVNEFAILANKLGIDVWEVIRLASTKPFGFMPFWPGPGVGGHCIPDDPVYLSWRAKKVGFKTKMIDLASQLNHFMPSYVVERVERALEKKGKILRGAKILILGVTYKRDVKDLRESPSLDIIELLQKKKSKVNFYDPLIPYLRIDNIDLKRIVLNNTNLSRQDCIIIITDHANFDYGKIKQKAQLVFDCRNVYKKEFSNIERL